MKNVFGDLSKREYTLIKISDVQKMQISKILECSLIFLLISSLHFCSLERKLKLKTMLGVSVLSASAGTASSSSASASSFAAPTILNLTNKSSVESGFMIGAALPEH